MAREDKRRSLAQAALCSLIIFFLNEGIAQKMLNSDVKVPEETSEQGMKTTIKENLSLPLSDDGAREEVSSVKLASSSRFPLPTNGRLPTWIFPINYEIRLEVFLNNASYEGSVAILFEAVNETDKIILNMVDLVTKNESCEVSLAEEENKIIPIANQKYNYSLQFYIIHLNQTLDKGNKYKLRVAFLGTLNNKLIGFYLSTYKNAKGNEIRVASTQFSPTDARRAFPCFDEPNFKATFEIIIERDANMTALSNMPVSSTSPAFGKEGRFVDRFEKTLKMSTYLIGFMVSDFGYRCSNVLNGTKFRVWSRRQALNQTSYALEVGPKLLLYLEDYFGVKYPLPKLDMVAIPDFKFSGMENWGLIMYSESAVLFDPAVSSILHKRNIIRVISHELAHMWFGNLVTPKWWSDLWLKEGFATFMGYKAVDQVEPSWKMMDYMVQSSNYYAFALDSLQSSHPINVEVDHPDRISEIFDDISYSKGASIIRMMQYFLTEEVYRRGMQDYIRHLQYSNAEQKDLWHFLTEAWKQERIFDPKRNVETIMNTWTLQDGYPVVTLSNNGSHLFLSQKRFLLQKEQNSAPAEDGEIPKENKTDSASNVEYLTERKWWIPISYVKKSSPYFDMTQPRLWMAPTEEVTIMDDLPDENEWIILNVQKTAFYRVNYDKNNWHALLQQLMKNHSLIHHLNRAQLLDDALNLAKAGLLDYDLPLQMEKYMRQEDDLTAWTMFLSNYKYIYDMAKTTTEIAPFNEYLLDVILPLYNSTGFEDKPGELYAVQSLRSLATEWVCRAEHEPCLIEAQELFEEWLEFPANTSSVRFSRNVKSTVLCNGIKNASYEVWNKTFESYLSSNAQTEKLDILSALGCSKSPLILERYLEMSLNPNSGIIKQDSFRVFKSVSTSKIGRDLAWSTIKEKWREIVQYFGSGSNALWGIFEAPTKTFNTRELVEELEEFRQTQADFLGSARQTVEKSLEIAKMNADWMQNHFFIVLEWLKTN